MRLQKSGFRSTSYQPLISRLRKILQSDRLHHFFFALASPENPAAVEADIHRAQLLGTTRDNCLIVLAEYFPDSALIREIGRLRELTFRKVGEGSGKRRDLDQYDEHYQHLVVWDQNRRVIAGAYRLCDSRKLLQTQGKPGFYTHSLYHFEEGLLPFLASGMELGRSFVNPDYWGKASLDYLWQGIGAYLQHVPHIRYLLGPVSMSARFPSTLTAELVYYYKHFHNSEYRLASARIPYRLDKHLQKKFAEKYKALNADQAMDVLQESFTRRNLRMPVLFKQYTALFEKGGFHALGFSVDPSFGDCVDVLCMADLSRLKAKKRKRYIPLQEDSKQLVTCA